MDTLPANPSPDVNIKRTRKPNLKIVKFGDGYSQRNTFGLNQVAMEGSLSWSNINEAEKIILEDFAESHARGQAWLWEMPDEDEPRQWHLMSWEIVYVKYGVYTVAFAIEENFDIA